jgi:hypothetical protein
MRRTAPRPPGPYPPQLSTPLLGLPLWLVILIVLSLAISPIAAARAWWISRVSLATLQSEQQRVQEIDKRVHDLQRPPEIGTDGQYQREQPHVDGVVRIATDIWESGRLRYRDFFDANRLVARDEFRYQDGLIVEKIRSYFDADQRVFLIDYFGPDGVLIRKRFCPEGPERPCEVRVTTMRSKLPPMMTLPSIALYR